jgi:hypothetical protein
MGKIRVPVHGNAMKAVIINSDATEGATVGVNLFAPDGKTLVQWADILNPKVTAGSGFTGTTDDVDEGQFNLYFTKKRAQDAVGEILVDSDTISLTYDPSVPSIKAELVDLQAIALTALDYPNVVALDGAGNAYYPDLTNPSDVARIIGVTTHAAALGAPVNIVTSRDFTEIAWSWLPGRIYCALSGGALTQTVPTTGAIVEVARAVSSTTIRVGITPGILR